MAGRKPKIIRPVALCLKLPSDLMAKLSLHLVSDVEGRVPQGAYQQFFIELIQEYFAEKAPLKEIRSLLKAIGQDQVMERVRTVEDGRRALQWLLENVHLDENMQQRIQILLSTSFKETPK